MRIRSLAAGFSLFLLLSVAAAQNPTIVALRAARLIDGKSSAVVTNAVVIVEGQKIKSVGANLSIPPGAKVIDLGDATLLPGLIDVHTHLLKEMLESGITTVRDLGNSGVNGDVALAAAIRRGWLPGPRMIVSTRALAAQGGQFGKLTPEAQALIEQEYVTIRGPESARQAVRQALYDGATCIKVIVNGSPANLTMNEMKA